MKYSSILRKSTLGSVPSSEKKNKKKKKKEKKKKEKAESFSQLPLIEAHYLLDE